MKQNKQHGIGWLESGFTWNPVVGQFGEGYFLAPTLRQALGVS